MPVPREGWALAHPKATIHLRAGIASGPCDRGETNGRRHGRDALDASVSSTRRCAAVSRATTTPGIARNTAAGGRSGMAPGRGAGGRRLPRLMGGGRPPPKPSAKPRQPVVPPAASCVVASSLQATWSGGGAPGRVSYGDFLLPGGLTMAWMWLLEPRTNSLLPPSSWVVWYAPVHGTMWSVAPATTYAARSTRLRSTGVPSTLSVPGRARPFEPKGRRSRSARRGGGWCRRSSRGCRTHGASALRQSPRR
jgi:hypothetical protein